MPRLRCLVACFAKMKEATALAIAITANASVMLLRTVLNSRLLPVPSLEPVEVDELVLGACLRAASLGKPQSYYGVRHKGPGLAIGSLTLPSPGGRGS